MPRSLPLVVSPLRSVLERNGVALMLVSIEVWQDEVLDSVEVPHRSQTRQPVQGRMDEEHDRAGHCRLLAERRQARRLGLRFDVSQREPDGDLVALFASDYVSTFRREESDHDVVAPATSHFLLNTGAREESVAQVETEARGVTFLEAE